MNGSKEQEKLSGEELEELIDWVYKIHGFDFEGYTRASLKRRVVRILQMYDISFADLKSLLVNSPDFFAEFVAEVTVNVTEMFRDPLFYRAISEKVVPYLSTFPFIKVWNAGCSTGEEVYSFAILLQQHGLDSRTFMYGTDINTKVLDIAKSGIYDLNKMKEYASNFLGTGLHKTLSDYYVAGYDAVTISSSLKRNILFSVHNLATDGVFNEFQLISCRNVLIYFNIGLQKKVLKLFYESLCHLGFLCLGPRETLARSEFADRFRTVDKKLNIYQKIA